MSQHTDFWQLAHVSNQQLLDGLGGALRRQRSALTELIAHLGEVEERRLHLEAAHGSMFDYCISRLGMSEDEACRRIELARLARKFPALFPLLASGEISLSVALLLKPVLTAENHRELIESARRKSMREARELVATIAPRPDVISSIRKLPERLAEVKSASDAPPASTGDEVPRVCELRAPAAAKPPTTPLLLTPSATPQSEKPLVMAQHSPEAGGVSTQLRATGRIEPLSAQRYKVQFTADIALKAKLEQARDLLRHAHPNGDFAPILARALDLLIADLLKRRFGAGARRTASRKPASPTHDVASSAREATTRATPSQVSRAARREVLARDGLGCTWVGPNGKRCGSRAWLEIDHHHPKGKGGGAAADNLRVLCRAHNRLAAEREYGRTHIEQAIAARRRNSSDPRWSGPP